VTRSWTSPPDAAVNLLRGRAAKPRPTGSQVLAAARERCRAELIGLGFETRELPFEFSSFPGRYATPLFGLLASIIVIGAARHAVAKVPSPAAAGLAASSFLVLIVAAALLAAAGFWLGTRGVEALPLFRERGVNTEAVRAGATPRVWLCAHLDTKSQPVPSLVRAAGIVMTALGYVFAAALALFSSVGGRPSPQLWTATVVVTLVAAIPVVLSIVTRRSPGALDNASGVATVIDAARALHDRRDVGVLITDAEELGLAGARIWSRGKTNAVVLNCDGVDDSGAIVVMFSGRRPSALLDTIARASRATGATCGARRLIPGVLTDSVAFSGAGLESVTFSRGRWRSLARVHSRRDDLQHLDGTGIAPTAALMAATVRELRAGETR